MNAERHFNLAVATERAPLQDHCGLVAAFSPGGRIKFLRTAVTGLAELQTRGYEGAGVVAFTGDALMLDCKGEGRVEDVFPKNVVDDYAETSATLWIGQVRYGTSGDPNTPKKSTQPIRITHASTNSEVVIAHNGQFKNKPKDNGSVVSDTVHFGDRLRTSEGNSWEERLLNLISQESGAYALTIGTPDGLYLIRDPQGIRPLAYGHYWDETVAENVWVAASETDALGKMGVHEFVEVMPGEIVIINDKGVTTKQFAEVESNMQKLCSFEGVYLLSGGSKAHTPRDNNGEINYAEKVGTVRRRTGEILAREAPLTKDVVDFVIGIPGTGIAGGKGFASALELPYIQAVHDSKMDNDRTFMTADISTILEKAMGHFQFDTDALTGKRVVIVDDSIVRGNITKALVKLLKERHGATAVHVRVVSPPIDDICILGINTRTKSELIAAQAIESVGQGAELSEIVELIRKDLMADSLAYLSVEGLKEAQTGNPHDERLCTDCMMQTKAPELNGHTFDIRGSNIFSAAIGVPVADPVRK